MSVHPFVGQGFSADASMRFWDDYAHIYMGDVLQGDIPERVVADLMDDGLINNVSRVLEFGCGPGTYSIPLARKVQSVSCVDSSPKMIEKLSERSSAEGLDNITCVQSDFSRFTSDKRFDLVISTICPGTASLEGLRLMESHSNGPCCHAMWYRNALDDLNAEIWHNLGYDYSYDGRKKSIASENLRRMGRGHTVRMYDTDVVLDVPLETFMARERKSFVLHGIGDVGEAVMDVIDPFLCDGTVHLELENRMRVITWEVS